MRMLHLADLHIGKRLYGVSMLDEQRAVLTQILSIADERRVDVVLIAGDVYDKPAPSAEAVELFDWFLTELAGRERPVLIISGNHDSAERLAFGAALLEARQVYLSPPYQGPLRRVTLEDADGPVDFYLLPFVKPALVRPVYPEVEGYEAAVRAALTGLPADRTRRNVLLAHQFVTGAAPSESEERIVGGTEEVPASCFEGFNYVALGHLHRAQQAGAPHIRYGGSPLQYAFSEGAKTVTVVELDAAGAVTAEQIPLQPPHPLRTLRGPLTELLEGSSEDYLCAVLTDEFELPDAAARLRAAYPNLLRVEYDNTRTRNQQVLELHARVDDMSPLEIFAELYQLQNGQALNEAQQEYLARRLEELP